nr:venom protein [Lampona murina]
MKILLVFFFVAVVFSAELQVEEKDVELVRNGNGDATYYYKGCKKYWEGCWTHCSCCGKYAYCRKHTCYYSYAKDYCKWKKEECGEYSGVYKCDFCFSD